MQCDKSVLYYTGNGDYPRLEGAVRDTIAKNSDGLPIVSVSHEPLEFGQNICVGPLQQAPEHVFMQLRVAAQIATSEWVCVCEADTLYSPEFFRFQPTDTGTYYYPESGHVIWKGTNVYYQKNLRELTGVVGRKHLLSLLDTLQRKHQEIGWPHKTGSPNTMRIDKIVASSGKTQSVDLGPVVTIKTGRGMHLRSPRSRRNNCRSLPVWGEARQMWRTYRCE